jgi:hypothetical protein
VNVRNSEEGWLSEIMMRSNVNNPQTVYKEQRRKCVEGARAAGGKKGGAGLVLQDVVRARTTQEMPDAGWLRDGES